MKNIKLLLILLMFSICMFSFAGCDDKSSGEISLEDDSYEDEDLFKDEGERISIEEMNTFSLEGIPITEEFLDKIYNVMQKHDFEVYEEITSEEWELFSDEEKHKVYEVFLAILTDLDLPVNAKESSWIKLMNEDADFYTDFLIWGYALENLGFTEPNVLEEFNRYTQGIYDGKYSPLHPEIFAAADDISVECTLGQYLLCVGGDHEILQISKEWSTKEDWFATGGFLTPVPNDDIFEREQAEFLINGENGKMETAYAGDADLLPIFKAMGAIAEDGSMAHKQIQISGKIPFDQPSLYIMSETDNGEIKIAVLKYSLIDKKYIWDNKILTTNERCCFSKDGEFCYIDESGIFTIIKED